MDGHFMRWETNLKEILILDVKYLWRQYHWVLEASEFNQPDLMGIRMYFTIWQICMK